MLTLWIVRHYAIITYEYKKCLNIYYYKKSLRLLSFEYLYMTEVVRQLVQVILSHVEKAAGSTQLISSADSQLVATKLNWRCAASSAHICPGEGDQNWLIFHSIYDCLRKASVN